jgi:hypothetical protein
VRPKLGALPIYKGLRLLPLVYFVFYCLIQPRAFVLGLFYLLFTMSSEMYKDLIQYQAKRIEALANELKKQEETINELKKKINDEK